MEYTENQLRVIYKALKGANLLGILRAEIGCGRQSVFNTFNAPQVQYMPDIVSTGLRLLKEADVLQDIQILTELIN
jgi:hypothetical protein